MNRRYTSRIPGCMYALPCCLSAKLRSPSGFFFQSFLWTIHSPNMFQPFQYSPPSFHVVPPMVLFSTLSTTPQFAQPRFGVTPSHEMPHYWRVKSLRRISRANVQHVCFDISWFAEMFTCQGNLPIRERLSDMYSVTFDLSLVSLSGKPRVGCWDYSVPPPE